jgi:hypothetical protein
VLSLDQIVYEALMLVKVPVFSLTNLLWLNINNYVCVSGNHVFFTSLLKIRCLFFCRREWDQMFAKEGGVNSII